MTENRISEENYRNIIEELDAAAAFFHMVLDENGRPEACIIEACNRHYLDVSEKVGLKRGEILHHSYYDLSPDHDPRWDYYIYQAAILRKHVHSGFRNREFGTWMEFSGGPAIEQNICWMVFIDHTQIRDENERLSKERNIDILTGVKNRSAYEDTLVQLRQTSIPVGVIMADINGLKDINDEKGHAAGDRLIEDAATFLCTIQRGDLPYRIGGDEFILLFPFGVRDDVRKNLDKIRSASHISVSCGGAFVEKASDIDRAVKEADAAMYEDKKKYYRSHVRKHVS